MHRWPWREALAYVFWPVPGALIRVFNPFIVKVVPRPPEGRINLAVTP